MCEIKEIKELKDYHSWLQGYHVHLIIEIFQSGIEH